MLNVFKIRVLFQNAPWNSLKTGVFVWWLPSELFRFPKPSCFAAQKPTQKQINHVQQQKLRSIFPGGLNFFKGNFFPLDASSKAQIRCLCFRGCHGAVDLPSHDPGLRCPRLRCSAYRRGGVEPGRGSGTGTLRPKRGFASENGTGTGVFWFLKEKWWEKKFQK